MYSSYSLWLRGHIYINTLYIRNVKCAALDSFCLYIRTAATRITGQLNENKEKKIFFICVTMMSERHNIFGLHIMYFFNKTCTNVFFFFEECIKFAQSM